MDSPDSYRISVPGSTQELSESHSVFAYGTVTLFGRLSHTFLLTQCFLTLWDCSLLSPTTPPQLAGTVWALPRSLATTEGIISFPLGTEMFQFPRFPSSDLCVQPEDAAG